MANDNQKQKAKEFIKTWKEKLAQTPEDKSNERQFCQLFWTTLLTEVFGVENIVNFIDYEKPVPKEANVGKVFIDGYISSTLVLIEQKATKIDLTKGEKQSDGQFLTPFLQAKRYSDFMERDEKPKWIIVSNFNSFEIHDMNNWHSAPIVIKLEDLAENLHNLSMLIDTGKKEIKEEMALSVEAGKIVDELYEILAKEYADDSPEVQKSLNMLCVRLIFLLYADDAELFGRKGMFHDFVASYNAQNLRKGIMTLFQNLNTKEEDRDKYEDKIILEFPYVNGNLFSKEDNLIPQFNEEIKSLLLEKGNFNWKDISPTIFGAVFESTLNPETRHDGGMHYTSIENIHKVIDPLFLDDLKDEFESIKKLQSICGKKKENFTALQDKIASIKIFDPACGSGNFLTESYLSLRRLENQILSELGNTGLFVDEYIKVSIQQFYGIEINDFAVSVAKTALWIAEAQTFLELPSSVNSKSEFFPLETYNNIVEGNALRMDWKEVFTPACHSEQKNCDAEQKNCHSELDSESLYIIGNPPFLGYSVQSKEQKEDLQFVMKDFGKNLDYVSGWYKKAFDLIKGTDIKCALVSTNSITQGEQPAALFKPLFEEGFEIDFAHRTFRWDSESTEKAHVHCVIIGFSSNSGHSEQKKYHSELDSESHLAKRIYTSDSTFVEAKNINAYLLDGPNIFIENRKKPLCNVSEMIKGSSPVDGGNLIIEESDYNDFIKKDPNSIKFIKPFIGSEEFISNKKRYCLWLVDANPKEILQCPLIVNRIENVKDMRLKSSKEATKKFADFPTRFMELRQPETDYLLVPRVSSEKRKYIPIGYMSKDVICSDANMLIPNATLYDFGILTSNVHNAWMRAVAGRLEMRYRYSNTIVYNNFPFVQATSEQIAKIEKTARAILDARAKYSDSTLGEMYSNLLLYPELNKAHKENDRAVMEAYGFSLKMTESECVAELFKMYEKLAKNA